MADVVRARITHKWMDPKFLCYQINSDNIIAQFKEQTKGTTRPRVNLTKIRSIKVMVCPFPEQIRLVEKLEELLSDLDSGVSELTAAQKKLGKYRQSVLKAAVEGTLTADWRANHPPQETGTHLLERILREHRKRWEEKQLAKFKEQGKTPLPGWRIKYPEPVKPDTTLPELPNGWVWTTLSQIGWLDRGRSKHRPRNAPHLFGGPYPFVQTGDIRNADTFISHASSSYSEAGLAQSRLWPTNTLCITIAANIGKTAILQIDACFPDSVVGFLPVSDDTSVRYVEYYMRTCQQELEEAAPATAQKNINLEILGRVCIPLPPLKEQLKIVSALDDSLKAARDQGQAIETGIHQSAAQRKNILKTAFAGQLVPQDPNDEPAAVLLERIRVERAEREKQPKLRTLKVKKEIKTMVRKLIDVLAEAKGWLPAQEAFRRCGVADGAQTDQIEALYAELRELDKDHQLAVESVTDAQGRKLHDRLKLLAKA